MSKGDIIALKILGIDPGLNITGYGLIQKEKTSLKLIEAGIIKTSSKTLFEDRLKTIFENIAKILTEYKPDVCVLEKLYSHYRHPTTVILMGHARGVICCASSIQRIKLVGYSVKRINKAVIGRGNATKTQIQMMVTSILNLKKPPTPNDVTDALALAIGHAYIIGAKV